jgi:hypothetical protein
MPAGPRKGVLFALLGVLVVFVLLAFWAFFMRKLPATIPGPDPLPMATPASSTESLGGDLYEKTSNPLGDKLPEQSATIESPINDAYKNPFE